MKLVKCSVHDIYPKWDDVGNRFYCPTCNLLLFAELHDVPTREWNEKNPNYFNTACGNCGRGHFTDASPGERWECPKCGFYTLKEE